MLGPLLVDGSDSGLVRRDQVVLSALAVRIGEAVSSDELAVAMWNGSPPRTWPKVVQGCVLRLRRVLGTTAIQTTNAGYRLALPSDDLDSVRFERLIERGTSLAVLSEFDRAGDSFAQALELWRGRPYEFLDGWSTARIELTRLEELRRTAEERLLDARLECGEHREVVAVAEARVAEEPWREHRWATLALTLYRCGRQAEALRALRHARNTLVEELGIDPGAELTVLEAAILRQDEALMAVSEPPSIGERCPYQGLASYDVDDNDRFFGRNGDIAVCIDRLRCSTLLVVTGPSGCGKSSLVRAGLVPALARDGRTVVVFVPGSDPVGAMSTALSSCTGTPVLVVDQFEELFLHDDDRLARSFCARLAEYATQRAPVIVVVRTDHLAALAVDEQLARRAEQGLHLVASLAGDSLRQAIEGPAAQAGLRLEHGLVDLLVRDCEGEPGAMPLLSHALVETWQRRDGRVLTVEGYRASGEIRGAVAHSADRLYESLPADQRPILRSLLLRLVSPSPDGPPVRSRIRTSAIGGDRDRERVLRMLVLARLVTTEEDSVELAHEALARAWPRLQSWLDEDAAGQRILRHLTAAADGWESLDRPSSELYRGARLEATVEWREATSPDLTDLEVSFLATSVAAAVSERCRLVDQARHQARQNRRLRRALVGVAILLAASIAGGAVAYHQRQTARREERQAALTALTGNASALRSNRRDLAALLAVEAYRFNPSPATESALFGTFTGAPTPTRTTHIDLELASQSQEVVHVPGTETLALSDGFGSLDVIDLGTGDHQHFEGPGDNNARSRLAVSADGQYAAVGWSPPNAAQTVADRYSLLDVRNLQTGEVRHATVRIPFAIGALAISADGSSIATSEVGTGRTAVYDGESGDLRVEIEHPAPANETAAAASAPAVAFTADGELILGALAGPVRVVDPADGSTQRRIDAPALTTDGQMWVDDHGSKLVTLGSIRDDGTRTLTALHLDESRSPAPESNEVPECRSGSWAYAGRINAVVCADYSGRVLAYHVESGDEVPLRFDSQQGDVCGVAVSADGLRLFELASCTFGNATIIEWRLDGGGPVSRHVNDSGNEHQGYVQGYGYRRDANALVAELTDKNGDIYPHVIDPSTGEIVDRFPGVYGLSPTSDPNVMVAVFSEEWTWDNVTIGRYNVVQREPVGPRVDPGMPVWGLWTSGDRVMVTGPAAQGPGSKMVTIDLDSGQLIPPSLDWSGQFVVNNLAISPDALYTSGLVLAEGGFDTSGSIRTERRDLNTGDVTSPPAIGYDEVAVGGGKVILSSTDGRIVEADPLTLEPSGTPFPGVTGPVQVMNLDSTGQRLLVHTIDGTLRVYDVPSRTQLGDAIEGATTFDAGWSALRPDGFEAASDTPTGLVIWYLKPDQWTAAACRLAGRNLTQAEWDQYLGTLGPYRPTCAQFPAATTG